MRLFGQHDGGNIRYIEDIKVNAKGYSKTVPAAVRPCYEDSADNGRRFGRQVVKEVAGMWILKFYKAYVKNKRQKNARVLGQDEIAS